jgi:hypothetical protein
MPALSKYIGMVRFKALFKEIEIGLLPFFLLRDFQKQVLSSLECSCKIEHFAYIYQSSNGYTKKTTYKTFQVFKFMGS